MQRAVVMVTGMSGSGKSTVLAELAHRGHRVVDTDEAGWIVEGDTADGLEPLWDLDRVRALITEHRTGWLFVSGCVANQGALYEHFDQVVLLSAPLDVILARVTNRANSFGSTPQDRAKIHADLVTYEPLLRAGAGHEVKTTVAVTEVATTVERIAGAAWPSG